jgi:2-polyprenyl-6-methoxyphenol hydroxylase-like FAD-dependent oxidoreductase
MSRTGKHALILGASMSGLLAARTLSDFYDKVTIVERDLMPSGPAHRSGVPHDVQPHLLLARGSQILADLFPGFTDDLDAAGVPAWKDGDLAKFAWSIGGHLLTRSGRLRDPAGLQIYFPSRPLLEHLVFKRIQKVRNIFVMDGHDVAEVTFDTNRISGARVVNIDTGDTTAVTADLVVDATGRGSRTPALLEALGYDRPQQDEIVVRLTYTSQFLSIPVSMRPDVHVASFPKPGRPEGYALWRNENDTWVFCVATLGRHTSPSQRADMISHVERIAPRHFVDTVQAAEPLGQPVRYTFPSSRWRRYDKMRNTPDGLVAVGDAICSFNPIYGQGMTVAAIEALTLGRCLREGQRKLPQRFFRSTAKTIGVAWRTAVGSDLALPEVTGRPTVSMRFTGAYLDRVLTAAESDPIVAEQLLRVTGMIDSSSRLLHPAILARVAAARRRPSEGSDASSGYIFSDG